MTGASSAARRDLVLRYPDLAQKLTEPPLGYRRPQDWTGWIPPAALELEACERCRTDPGKGGCRRLGHTARMNTSARRAALVEIHSEAERRAQAAIESRGPDGA